MTPCITLKGNINLASETEVPIFSLFSSVGYPRWLMFLFKSDSSFVGKILSLIRSRFRRRLFFLKDVSLHENIAVPMNMPLLSGSHSTQPRKQTEGTSHHCRWSWAAGHIHEDTTSTTSRTQSWDRYPDVSDVLQWSIWNKSMVLGLVLFGWIGLFLPVTA